MHKRVRVELPDAAVRKEVRLLGVGQDGEAQQQRSTYLPRCLPSYLPQQADSPEEYIIYPPQYAVMQVRSPSYLQMASSTRAG